MMLSFRKGFEGERTAVIAWMEWREGKGKGGRRGRAEIERELNADKRRQGLVTCNALSTSPEHDLFGSCLFPASALTVRSEIISFIILLSS